MTSEQIEKLNDYVDGILSLQNTTSPSIGAILLDESSRTETIDTLKKSGTMVLAQNSLETYSSAFIEALANGAIAAVDITSPLLPASYNFLLNVLHDNAEIDVAGEGKKKVIISEKSRVIFVASKELYDNGEYINRLASSVCRL